MKCGIHLLMAPADAQRLEAGRDAYSSASSTKISIRIKKHYQI